MCLHPVGGILHLLVDAVELLIDTVAEVDYGERVARGRLHGLDAHGLVVGRPLAQLGHGLQGPREACRRQGFQVHGDGLQ